MPSSVNNGIVDMYADDTTLTVNGKTTADVEHKLSVALMQISSWLNTNRLVLNYDKTNVMIIGSRAKLKDVVDFRVERAPSWFCKPVRALSTFRYSVFGRRPSNTLSSFLNRNKPAQTENQPFSPYYLEGSHLVEDPGTGLPTAGNDHPTILYLVDGQDIYPVDDREEDLAPRSVTAASAGVRVAPQTG
ncbi:uncharacterized protein LOC119721465 [Patiria miniata]|uniref:Reverse transcriptase domain-containing protein n=1 Tax=Patiria miniata TaxID=46514 RepID=A0A913Z6Z5_PATMI|nr:uncharacterized protein LOC119721465 [Patiria miniata]